MSTHTTSSSPPIRGMMPIRRVISGIRRNGKRCVRELETEDDRQLENTRRICMVATSRVIVARGSVMASSRELSGGRGGRDRRGGGFECSEKPVRSAVNP